MADFKWNPFTQNLDMVGTASGGSGIATLTGNTGGAIGPDGSGNVNIVGTGDITVTGSGNTLTINSSSGSGFVQTLSVNGGATVTPITGNFDFSSPGSTISFTDSNGHVFADVNTSSLPYYSLTPLIVGSDIHSQYSTISAALAVAVAGQRIYVKPGTYTENLTLVAGVDIVGATTSPAIIPYPNEGDSYIPTNSVIILGTATASYSPGIVNISNVTLRSNGGYAVVITGDVGQLYLNACIIDAQANQAINATAGTICVSNSIIEGTGASALISGSGDNNLWLTRSMVKGSNISLNNDCSLAVEYCDMFTNISNNSSLNMSALFSAITGNITGTQGISAVFSSFSGGSDACINISSPGVSNLTNCYLTTADANIISGTGQIIYAGLSLGNPTANPINATTQTPQMVIPGVLPVSASITSNYAPQAQDYFLSVDSSGGAITLTLLAGPARGQTYVIKDTTGSAAAHNITISGNGKNILGTSSAGTYVMTVNYGSATIIYNGTAWCVV